MSRDLSFRDYQVSIPKSILVLDRDYAETILFLAFKKVIHKFFQTDGNIESGIIIS